MAEMLKPAVAQTPGPQDRRALGNQFHPYDVVNQLAARPGHDDTAGTKAINPSRSACTEQAT